MLSTRRIAALFAVGAAFAVPMVGCGSSSSSSSTESSNTPAAGTAKATGPGGAVDLTATDFKFTPSDSTVKPGEVSFNLKNDSQTTHSLEIEDVTPGHDQKMDQMVAPGQSGTLKVNLAPGKYDFYCPVDGHKQLGMTGEVTVQ